MKVGSTSNQAREQKIEESKDKHLRSRMENLKHFDRVVSPTPTGRCQ